MLHHKRKHCRVDLVPCIHHRIRRHPRQYQHTVPTRDPQHRCLLRRITNKGIHHTATDMQRGRLQCHRLQCRRLHQHRKATDLQQGLLQCHRHKQQQQLSEEEEEDLITRRTCSSSQVCLLNI